MVGSFAKVDGSVLQNGVHIMNQRPWQFVAHDRVVIQGLQSRHRISPILAQLLAARGISQADQVQQFLDFKLSDLQDPSGLPGALAAARRILTAIASQQRIWIFGDYDADGMTSTAILYRCIKLLGGQVKYYVPSRLTEGYGLSAEALDVIHGRGADLVITVDCGIASVQAAEHAKKLGLSVVITDHHTMGETLPIADAIVHPALPGCHPMMEPLCGAGVAFKVAWALAQLANDDRIESESNSADQGAATETVTCGIASESAQASPPSKRVSPELREFLLMALGWAAIGTVADVVPLVGENRILVRFGLAMLKSSPGLGLQHLMQLAKLNERATLKSDDIGFALAPRLNAAGRLGQALLAVELLVTENRERAEKLAQHIDQLNVSRDSLDRKIFTSAVKMLKEDFDLENDSAIVLADPNWHVGVIGIASGRLAEKFGLPTVLISLDPSGNRPGTGSCRSGGGLDLYQALQACSEHLEGFGGHKAAAGLRILPEKIDAFRVAFWDYTQQHLDPAARRRPLRIDAEAALHQLTLETLSEIEKMAPFGQGNPVPTLCSSEVEIIEPKTMGGGDRHLSAQVKQFDVNMRVVAFGKAEWIEPLTANEGPIDIAYKPIINEFRGYRRVELQLIDWRPSRVPATA